MQNQLPSVFVHVVAYKSDCEVLSRCIDSLLLQVGYNLGQNLSILVTDNGSKVPALGAFLSSLDGKVLVRRNSSNLGFCGAHNQGAFDFLDSGAEYLCILNPDCGLDGHALAEMVKAFSSDESIGAVTPLLLRANESLEPLQPVVVDAAGMYLSHSLRHFDRSSGQLLSPDLLLPGFVFGGTGACLLLSRSFVQDIAIAVDENRHNLFSVFPQLQSEVERRWPLFDEAFFAYREDADLAWRSQLLGWKCLYWPAAKGYHMRVVLPERRKELSPSINLMGVRNRFLLQLNNFSLALGARAFIYGLVVRNLMVVLGVLIKERTSLKSFEQILLLWPRARARRVEVLKRAKARRGSLTNVSFWFDRQCEKI